MPEADLTRSGLEWKRNSRIFVPIAPLGGSSNAVNARVDSATFMCFNQIENKNRKNIRAYTLNEKRMYENKYNKPLAKGIIDKVNIYERSNSKH